MRLVGENSREKHPARITPFRDVIGLAGVSSCYEGICSIAPWPLASLGFGILAGFFWPNRWPNLHHLSLHHRLGSR